MSLYKKYLKFTVSLLLILASFLSFSQEKSSNIKTLNGKKYYIHKVEKKQSLYAISKIYGIDINLILAENDEAIDGIKDGQELKIPFPNQTTVIKNSSSYDTTKYVYHKVAKKETIYAICKLYNISENQLNIFNPDLSKGIKPGQMLVVAEKKKAVVTATLAAEPKKDSVLIKPKKNTYNIGLFLPFKLNELELLDPNNLVQNKAPFPALQSLAVDFYLGFKRAADSLSAKDFSVNIQLFDVDDKDSLKPELICKSPEFKFLDLIIGPLFPAGFKTVSGYAKQFSIPIVSPFTQQNKILFKNNLTSKVSPSQYTLLESLADYCVDSLKINSTVFIVNNALVKEVPYVKAFKERFNGRLKELGKPIQDSIIEVKGLAGFKASYKPGIRNVVVMLSNSQVYLTDFITQLAVYGDKKDLLLAGWQNVITYESIDHDYFNRLNYIFPSQNNISNVRAYSSLIKEYQSTMSSDPGDYFFQGFDMGQYYLQTLKTNGPAFAYELDKYPFEGNFTRFKFYHPDATTGFENRGVYIFKYLNYQLVKTGWK